MTLQQFLGQYVYTPQTRYCKTNTFKGIQGVVNSIIFIDHRTVVSAGDDRAISIWEVQEATLIHKIHEPSGPWGQVTSLVVTNTPDGAQGFVAGTGRGHILSFRRVRMHGTDKWDELDCPEAFRAGDFVEALAFEPEQRRLIVSSHLGALKMYQLEQNGSLTERWVIPHAPGLEQIVRGIHFVDQGQRFVTYIMETGNVQKRDSATGEEVLDVGARRVLQGFVANLDYFPDMQSIVIDNLQTGFEIYTSTRSSPTHRLTAIRHESYAVNVKFAEGGSRVVGGSDTGTIHIFSVGTGEQVQVLYQGGRSTPIQAIATCTSPDGELILATGSSNNSNASSTLCIWRKPRSGQSSSAISGRAESAVSWVAKAFSALYQAAFLMVALSMLWNLFVLDHIKAYSDSFGLSSQWYHEALKPFTTTALFGSSHKKTQSSRRPTDITSANHIELLDDGSGGDSEFGLPTAEVSDGLKANTHAVEDMGEHGLSALL